MATLLECSQAQYDKIFDVNLKSYWGWLKHVVPNMNRGGSVVMNASMGGYFSGDATPVYGVYTLCWVPAEEKARVGSYMLGRLGEPEECGRVVAFLCSDEAS